MKKYVSPELAILSYDDEVLTADVVSASPLTSKHEETDAFNGGWLDWVGGKRKWEKTVKFSV